MPGPGVGQVGDDLVPAFEGATLLSVRTRGNAVGSHVGQDVLDQTAPGRACRGARKLQRAWL